MTLLDLLKKAGAAVPKLVVVLDKAAERLPDLAPEIAEVQADLLAAIDPANLADVGAAIPGELLNIAKGKIDPKDHAGSSA